MYLHRASGRVLRPAFRSWSRGHGAARHLCSSSEPKAVEARVVGSAYQDIFNLGIARPKPFEQQNPASHATVESPKQQHPGGEGLGAVTAKTHIATKVVVQEEQVASSIVVEEAAVMSSATAVVQQSTEENAVADPTAKPELKAEEDREAEQNRRDGEQGTSRRKKAKVSYSAVQWEDEPVLRTPKGAEILKKLGLDQFFEVQPVEVNVKLCDEFLSSYTHHGYGIVQSNVVSITPEALHKVTGLPVGTEPMSRLTRDQAKTLKSVTKHMYNDYFVLNELKIAGEEETDQILASIGKLLMTKLRGGKRSNAVVGRILWGLHSSWRSGTQPMWPAYMAELMRSAAHRTRSHGSPFPYGSWLTVLIENSLQDGVTSEGEPDQQQQQQGQGQGGVLEASVNRRLMELRQKEEELYQREQELVKKEKKFKKFLVSMTQTLEPTGRAARSSSLSSSSSSSPSPLPSEHGAALA